MNSTVKEKLLKAFKNFHDGEIFYPRSLYWFHSRDFSISMCIDGSIFDGKELPERADVNLISEITLKAS